MIHGNTSKWAQNASNCGAAAVWVVEQYIENGQVDVDKDPKGFSEFRRSIYSQLEKKKEKILDKLVEEHNELKEKLKISNATSNGLYDELERLKASRNKLAKEPTHASGSTALIHGGLAAAIASIPALLWGSGLSPQVDKELSSEPEPLDEEPSSALEPLDEEISSKFVISDTDGHERVLLTAKIASSLARINGLATKKLELVYLYWQKADESL